jgi:hydroxyacylglutathione hydrolase
MEYILLPAFKDNYIHLLINPDTKNAIAIDPGEADPVIDYIEAHGLNLSAILITHHHDDHIDGVPGLKAVYSSKVFAPEKNKKEIFFADQYVKEGDKINQDGFNFEVWEIPGHTLGHIAYLETKENWFFCGDTLFSMGCGRLFEGTPEMMFNSLQRISKLITNTLIFCAHEYTESNLKFSLQQKTDVNFEMIKTWIEKRRKLSLPTIPTTVERELAYNLFLRAKTEADFAALRKLKDTF